MSAFISLLEAIQMTTLYRNNRRALIEPSLPEDTLPICETFDKEHVTALLDKDGCKALRAYLAMDTDNNVKLVLVGVNADDEDIYLGVDALVDKAMRCPAVCPPSSPLNT